MEFLFTKVYRSIIMINRDFLNVFFLFLFAAKVWGPDDGVPILALHGWLDNAGTFDRLAPLLHANIRLVCLDFCGIFFLHLST